MARNYRPKEITLIWEQVEASPEESKQRIDEAFDVLFEETMKYLQEKKQQSEIMKKSETTNFIKNNEEGGEHYGRYTS